MSQQQHRELWRGITKASTIHLLYTHFKNNWQDTAMRKQSVSTSCHHNLWYSEHMAAGALLPLHRFALGTLSEFVVVDRKQDTLWSIVIKMCPSVITPAHTSGTKFVGHDEFRVSRFAKHCTNIFNSLQCTATKAPNEKSVNHHDSLIQWVGMTGTIVLRWSLKHSYEMHCFLKISIY